MQIPSVSNVRCSEVNSNKAYAARSNSSPSFGFGLDKHQADLIKSLPDNQREFWNGQLMQAALASSVRRELGSPSDAIIELMLREAEILGWAKKHGVPDEIVTSFNNKMLPLFGTLQDSFGEFNNVLKEMINFVKKTKPVFRLVV